MKATTEHPNIVSTPTLMRVLQLCSHDPYQLDFYRLFNLEDAVHRTRHVAGSIIEGGTGKGLSLAMFHILTEAIGAPRDIWSYDSFEGLPEPMAADLAGDRATAKKGHLFFGGINAVKETLARAEIAADNPRIHLVPGWFNETMPKYDGPPVAILHIDGDLYESTMTQLECFWPKLAVGGIIVFDEYDNTREWPGEKAATDQFFSSVDPKTFRLYRDRFGVRWNIEKLSGG